ncbi:MAG: DUF5011 domain-containing protein [Candidatus Pacebacteria bacterium]|nr:DUF5011 domain-containing protein [Candidatus Paceibacterota bacterium]
MVIGGDTVNPNAAGSYTITYNVVDSESLAADEVTRTVTVEPAENPGIINICKLIVDENNVVIKLSESLPTGIFSILLATSTDVLNTTIETASWDASTFTPNRIFTSSSEDAECRTVSNLPLGSYYYGEETIAGAQWATTTKYNDGDTSTVNNVFDFFLYDDALFTATTTDDAGRETNADGNIVLSADRYERTLVILNKFSSETVPTQCSDQIDNDGDENIDINDPACHTDGDPENPDSYDPALDSENEKPVITLIGSNLTVTVGTSYTDEGATANDPEDGDITADIVVGGDSVDTSTPGSYTITYNVMDSESLAADEVTRTVTVESTGGTGGGGGCTSNCGGGGGGGPISTLQIFNETVEQAGPGAVVVKWNTNLSATRKVLYGTESISSLILPPVYGYATTTSQITDPLLTLHSVIITGLTPGETYYFRPWAFGSGHIATGIELTIVPGTSSAPVAPQSCYYLYDFLKQGENNNPIEVRKLQVFLNEFEGENLEVNGVFDDATFNAVSRFQEKYQGDILTPWGHSASTGYVYILTKKQVNEIYCQNAFPVTVLEQDEINSFHSFILSLTEAGIITEGEASSPTAPFGETSPSEVEGGVIDENTVGVGGRLDENDRNIAGVGGGVGSGFGLFRSGFLSSLAAAAFALPTNIPDAFVCFFTLLLALIIIYVAATLIIGAQNTSKLSQSQIRVRKILYFIVGVIVALIGAVYFNVFCLILPLAIVFLILLALLLWYSTRKGETDGVIGGSLPIKPTVMPPAPTPFQKTETETRNQN